MDIGSDINHEIVSFLSPLSKLHPSTIKNYDPILRIGIFYSTAYCTITLDVCNIINSMGVKLELSLYPSATDEAM